MQACGQRKWLLTVWCMGKLPQSSMSKSLENRTQLNVALDLQRAEEQALLDSLKPSQEEIEQVEFELKSLNLLMEASKKDN
jgi:hypothetical protein